MSSPSNVVRTIRLSNDALEELLDKLEEQAQAEDKANTGRGSERFRFRSRGCVIQMQQPGAASTTAFLVSPRNISSTGMAFLHGGYVHIGTECFIQLVSTHGAWVDIKARVVRCRFIQGNLHDVGVQFMREIEPGDFCAEAIKTRVLLVEDDPSLAKLTMHYLRQHNAEVEYAETGEAAIERVRQGSFDAVFMDIELPKMSGIEATQKIRADGYAGLIIALTAKSRQEDIDDELAAGCNRHVEKPVTSETLASILNTLKSEPLISSLQNDPMMAPLVDEFVASIPGKLRKIEHAATAADLKALEFAVRSLKGEGKSFGFDVISDTAGAIEAEIIAGAEIKTLATQINELNELCMLARGSK